MSLTRNALKAATVALLDSLAEEHPLGHQASKARRYVLSAAAGTPLEIMFEQDPSSSANLWAHARAAGSLARTGHGFPASALRTERGPDGKPRYGRHSALERMPQLGEADLVRLQLASLQELGAVLDQLLASSADRVSV